MSQTKPFCFLQLLHVKAQLLRLSKELLLVRLHVDVALKLSAGSADLEAESTSIGAGVKLLEALHAAVLHGVLEAGSKVGDELVDGAIKQSARRFNTVRTKDTNPRWATEPETPWATRTLSPSEK